MKAADGCDSVFLSCLVIWFNSIEIVQIRPSSDSVAHSYFTISFHTWQSDLFKICDSTILCYINPVGWVSPIQFLVNFTSSSASHKPVPEIVFTLFTEFASVINCLRIVSSVIKNTCRYWRQATSPRMWSLRAVLLGLILLSTAKYGPFTFFQ